eukprot:TRINITY_DN4220_c0_g1::TRINITY_DN4220_c0_g1_i1::g.8033::m.8033 TRINITY_DN4220_c0_g1::TRINITY_DN4220_c0_g1_i1::g.8033  ORF type:complete len:283 (+),score=39.02,sp/Q9SF29/SYP71_ARATH/29.54/7e-23,SNARE/PF05739.14/5.2e+03,SNARE/PF05739.14/9.2e-11,Syntaxin-6_N/PF09177.6/0.12,Syntaxin-6_N/PF09177.6/3.3e+02,DUF948/PF06103.6/6.1e+02,DUF948/PF06103.6/5.9e+02,DUF948/PF06103.6/0.06,NPV_P10/PF05531.7/4.1e+03,NPV_P10/PF05531.7/1.1e+02,NPV_P10/PF05531.7/0.43,Baculo_PEP_C/PF04513.7/2e+02,Baculo_PEP_C/PF04513.7
MNDLMNRLNRIERECGETKKADGDKDDPTDEFIQSKKEIARQIADIRKSIKERDELLGKSAGTKQTVEMSAHIRSQIRAVKDEAMKLKQTHQNDLRKKKKDKLPQEAIEHRNEVIDLAFKHISECEQLEKRRFTDKSAGPSADSRAQLLTSAAGGGQGKFIMRPATETDLRNIDDIDVVEGLKQIQEKDSQMDQDLDIISEGVGQLMHLARDMNTEINLQSQMVEEITTKVDNTAAHLQNINKKMKETLNKVRGPDRFCVDIILVIILLGICGYLYSMFKNK